ncbi:MAG: DUF1501 domain-containing protein [Planctomycetota bacterium]|nr:MAG: DUF1501 domain-containing protein [Planctomycetota bacterium]REK37393.1 MAG: DUF1501 domain-containing protein [Planctomycetota bacterium]
MRRRPGPFDWQQLSRRDALRISVAGGLSFLLPPLGVRAREERGTGRAKSLILLWMNGGQSQLESWDPHPGGPAGISTSLGTISTSIPGVEIAESYPQMAEQLHRVSVIRSLVSQETSHERGRHAVRTGHRQLRHVVHPTLGAILAHQLPTVEVALPPYLSLLGPPRSYEGGHLGHQYDAFKVHQPGGALKNVDAGVSSERLARRRKNLAVLTNSFRRGREAAAEVKTYERAVDRAQQLMDSRQLDVFRIDTESQATRAAYGSHEFGRGCLVARRLVERGVRVVEVSLNGWDSHVDNLTKQRGRAKVLDPAMSALIDDLAARDLLQSTVVLCVGEFGRTPTINKNEGRDHWPHAFSCLVGGGGIAGGRRIGATDPTGQSRAPSDPVSIPDLHATILATLGVEYGKRLQTPTGRRLAICTGSPVAQLLAE